MYAVALEQRPQASRLMMVATPPLAVALTLLAGAGLFAAMGFDPLAALRAYFITPLSSLRGVGELIVKATPLITIAVGLAVGFRAGVWNIGAEGQLTMGAICGGGVALAFYGQGGPWLLPLMILAGVAGGMAWAAIPAFLRTRCNANEILVSLMLTYVAVLLLSFLVHGPYRDPDGFAFPESRLFEDAALYPVLISGTRAHLGMVFALAAAAAAWVLLARAFIGFQIKVVGLTPAAAACAGFSRDRIIWFTLLLSGGLAGLAGLGEIAGPLGQITPSISPGYGFTAIIVAFLGRLNPLGIILSGLLVALSFIGGESAQIALGLPKAVTGVFQGMLLFFLLACDVLIRYRPRLIRLSPRKVVA
jgi:general nucleoside transport system permease protein